MTYFWEAPKIGNCFWRSNIQMNKIEILKKLIESEEDDGNWCMRQLIDLDKKYIGEKLKEEEERYNVYILESTVKIEAFRNELKNQEQLALTELLAEQGSTFDQPN